MRVLAIDTSNQTLALAVCEEDKILGQFSLTVKKNHSLTLMPAITNLMDSLGLTAKDIDRFVVAQGPGSYTGLRIGVTTAKTLAYTLKKELVGISSLKVVAANCVSVEGVIVPLFDARRKNVYTGAYQVKDGQWETVLADRHIAMTEWLDTLAEVPHVHFVGEDVASFRPMIEEQLPEARILTLPQWQVPNAAVLAALGQQADPVSDIHQFLPNYLKRVEAEENWLKTHQQEDENYVEKL